MTEGDLRIRILGKDADAVYRVEAQTDDGSFFQDQMQLSAAEDAALTAAEGDNRAYGARLARLLFSPKILGAYQQALGRAKAAGNGRVRIRLWISSDCAELHAYTWERLLLDRDGAEVALACAPALPFSRYTGLARPEPQASPEPNRGLRLLVAVANPTALPAGFEPIRVREELDALMNVLRQVDGLSVTVLPGRTSAATEEFAGFDAWEREANSRGFDVRRGSTTPEALAGALASHDVLHFLGHGAYSVKTRGSVLFLENEDGTVNLVKEDDAVRLVMNLSPLPRLLFLASCDTAKHPAGDARAFVSLGPRLVEAGFPAVVAMQAKAPMGMAHRLTLEFYRNLLDHGVIDLALNQARGLLFSTEQADWSIPVLFMRVPDGRLFQPDSVRATLHAVADSAAFADRPLISDLPLEAVVLTGGQLQMTRDGETVTNRVPPGWQRAVETALYRVDVLKQIQSTAAAAPEAPAYNLTILAAERGTEFSGLLRRFVRETALASLESRTGRPILPVYVDLSAYPATASGGFGRLHSLLARSLEAFWPDRLGDAALHDLVAGGRVVFRLLFDTGDDLPAGLREEILTAVERLAADHPEHQYYLALDPRCWDLDDVAVTALLAAQPLRRHRVETFLRARTGDLAAPMSRLADQLARVGLYDLAARPGLLLRMAAHAAQGRLPQRRAQVLASVLEDGVERIPAERGQQSRSRESLYALALRMQLSYRAALPVRETFETLAEVRGNREYNLEDALTCLTGQRLLELTPEGSVRFPYPILQSFCCARALAESGDRRLLDLGAASLGSPKSLRWWEETLILLSGLIPEQDREALVERIAYSSTLTEGGHLFLAARCIQESGLARKNSNVAGQVVDALVWRCDATNEPRTPRRVLAVRALGDLIRPELVRCVAAVACSKVRRAWDGSMAFEYGAVRQAAVRALYHAPDCWSEIGDASLVDIFHAWQNADIRSLAADLNTRSDADQASLAGAAAFALGDLQHLDAARAALYDSFAATATGADTRWSIADALLSLDPDELAERVIRPGIAAHRSAGISAGACDVLLYLVTQLRLPGAWALEFVESFLATSAAFAGCKGRALLALGMLNAQSWRDRLAAVALGDFSAISAGAGDPEADYLRQKALEALAEVGTMDQLAALRNARTKVAWSAQLARSFYAASEAISSRDQDVTARPCSAFR